MSSLMLFSGNSNPVLAAKIAERLGLSLGKARVGRFSDGEVMVEVFENVRGRKAFILQSTCAPCNDHLMEVLALSDALRRASATNITAVIPYFGYGRQDRRVRSARVPITARVVADMLAAVGIDRVLTVELHADQIQGFFSVPVDNVYSSPVVLEDLHRTGRSRYMVVSPDIGGIARARAIAKRLNNSDLAIIDKRRLQPGHSEVMHVIGEVSGRDCVLVDDIVDTAGTLCNAAVALKQRGARTVVAYCTHAVLSGAALSNITASPIDEMVVTDTIPLSEDAKKCSKIRVLSLADMLALAISRVNTEESLSSIFEEEASPSE